MLKKILFLIFINFSSGIFAQQIDLLTISKKIIFTNDTIQLENSSINNQFFRILDSNLNQIDSTFYKINFSKASLIFNKNYFKTTDSLKIQYQKYPDFLTKEYSIYDSNRLVKNNSGTNNLYKLNDDNAPKIKLFDGLNTSGSITRGITVGNNQNSVVNSNLDLQITGKLSDKLSIRGSIQDSNLPLRNGGYSQKLNQFDQIFIELLADNWNIRAGDLFLENRQSKFLNFNKKVQGLLSNFNFKKKDSKTNVFASAALVRGQYAKSNFVGQEGNQGPYKLRGPNGELYILVIDGSESVYVNGILLKRGENKDYIIDYNAGEIKFTSLFAITSEMRIVIEYQYTDQNYNRFISYAGATHEQKKWSISGYLYSENDLKDQSLQQNLSENQVNILKNSGDNLNLMTSESAFLDTFSTNKILYKKIENSGISYFEYSNRETDVLFNVRFSLVGNNAGNYVLASNNAIGKIYQYVAPISGVLQGNYEPIVKLVAPTKIQIATFLGKYNPSEKTNLDLELGISNNDQNLFSSIDDNNNKGLVGKLNLKQSLLTKKWHIDAFANYQFIQKNFKTIERLFSIEFNRDWNLTSFSGNQSYLVSGLNFELPNVGKMTYQIEKLDFSDSFSGNKHILNGLFKFKNFTIQNLGSYLSSSGNFSETRFVRNQTQTKFNFKKNWIGNNFKLEDNKERLKSNNLLSNLSQRFIEYGAFIGRGDSTKVFAEIGFLNRINDSLQNNFLRRVNNSNSFYLNSKLIKTEKSDLSIFINFRTLKFENPLIKNQNSLNSRLTYIDRFFKDFVLSTTNFETVSGTIAQQEFTYLEVATGLGVYTWKDYNNNGVQELQEFEIAPFIDQAKYVRVFLPNQIFIKTHQNKFSQNLTLNPNNWQNETGFKKILSHFYNQTNYLIERKIARKTDNFDLNPFKDSSDLLGLNASFRNSLFYNRGKQKNSVTYSYTNNQAKNLLSVGALENNNIGHELQYSHLIKKTWLFDLDSKIIKVNSKSENYAARNFEIYNYALLPKISYLFNPNTSLDIFYEYQDKKNKIGELENLKQSIFGTSFSYIDEKKITLNGEFSLTYNKFSGDDLSPVGFQMLEGLQSGKNLTWKLLLQKNLTQYLNLNINYQGRKSESNETIHNGNLQLKAFF
jgi:hypothetical protein